MITDAAIELSISLSRNFESVPHIFSKSFERNMKRLIRSVNHGVSYRFVQQVACFALVVFLGIISLVTAIPTARAAVIEWLRNQYEAYVEYFLPHGLQNNAGSNQYTISPLPDGYYETNRFDVEGSCTVLYANSIDSRIHFIYSKDPDAVSFLVMSDESTLINVDLEGCTADLYIPLNINEATSIVWYDNSRETIFYISGVLETDDLIELAKNVIEVSK